MILKNRLREMPESKYATRDSTCSIERSRQRDYSEAMTHRHAAALGLLIWYFMLMPVPTSQFSEHAVGGFANKSSRMELPQWPVEPRFETQAECRAFQWIYQQRFGEPGAETFAGVCELREPRRRYK
jgi:hypothetical protein